MEEVWKEVSGFRGRYRVSYSGIIERRLKGGLWETVSYYPNNRDYLMCAVGLVHRIVAIHHIPNPEAKPQVNHKDFNRYNCHGSNLEWSTARENTAHSIRNGRKRFRVSRGSNNGKSKLREEQVIEIRRLFDVKKNYEIAMMYDVNPSTISDIHRGATWQHV